MSFQPDDPRNWEICISDEEDAPEIVRWVAALGPVARTMAVMKSRVGFPPILPVHVEDFLLVFQPGIEVSEGGSRERGRVTGYRYDSDAARKVRAVLREHGENIITP
jgi:hypothetical protein